MISPVFSTHFAAYGAKNEIRSAKMPINTLTIGKVSGIVTP